jgi:hypothetical protein
VGRADFTAGGYRYLPAVFQYSSGVVAMPGFAIERARLARALPLAEGFAAVERHLASRGRSTLAFCACELRSPAPFTEQGFVEFNRGYVTTLERWGLYRDGVNPVARTNVCPALEAPRVPSLYAFSYTVPVADARTSFVVAGGGEASEGGASYRERIVRLGDTSPEGLRAKARFVVAAMEQRLAALGVAWSDATATHAYTVHDIGALVRDEIVARGAAAHGLVWHFARPPVVDLEFEMDVRGVPVEHVVPE